MYPHCFFFFVFFLFCFFLFFVFFNNIFFFFFFFILFSSEKKKTLYIVWANFHNDNFSSFRDNSYKSLLDLLIQDYL